MTGFTNPETIEQVFALQSGNSVATIPNGLLRRGSGAGDHNMPWSWHIDPEQISMAELTIEVCSGIPSFIENDMDEWIDNVKQFCPWPARLRSVEDFR